MAEQFETRWLNRSLMVIIPGAPWTLEYGDLEGKPRRWVLTRHEDYQRPAAHLLPDRPSLTASQLIRDISSIASRDVAKALVARVVDGHRDLLNGEDDGGGPGADAAADASAE
jgi:hypothetical protein